MAFRSDIPISKVCPKCGRNEYEKVQPEVRVAFAADRICNWCSTRYAPPTPIWARVIFAVIGLLAFLAAAGLGVAALLSSDPGVGSTALAAFAISIGCFYMAFRREEIAEREQYQSSLEKEDLVKFVCTCGQQLRAPRSDTRQKADCPFCGKTLLIPEATLEDAKRELVPEVVQERRTFQHPLAAQPQQVSNSRLEGQTPTKSTNRTAIDEAKLCFLCGNHLKAEEIPSRVCRACKTS